MLAELSILHIGIASVRKSLDLIVLHLPEEIENVVWGCRVPNAALRLPFWIAMGAIPKIADELATYGIRSDGTNLHCSSTLKKRPDWAEHLASVLMWVYNIGNFH